MSESIESIARCATTTTPSTFRLYNLTDDPFAPIEEAAWLAVWASTPADAEAEFRRWYEGQGYAGPGEYEVTCYAPNDQEQNATEPFMPDAPGHERRSEVLRLIGWRYEGESACESCELYPMDLDAYRLCPECECCPECSHAEDCPAKRGFEGILDVIRNHE